MVVIDIVFWDIKGKVFDVLVYDFFGGWVCEKVLSYCYLWGSMFEEMLVLVKVYVDLGWKVLCWELIYGDDMIM